jgi:hypothetical protein
MLRFLADESCDFAVVRALRAAEDLPNRFPEAARWVRDAETFF